MSIGVGGFFPSPPFWVCVRIFWGHLWLILLKGFEGLVKKGRFCINRVWIYGKGGCLCVCGCLVMIVVEDLSLEVLECV